VVLSGDHSEVDGSASAGLS